jgi:hypothetical protein
MAEHTIAMEKRMNALFRKAEPHIPAALKDEKVKSTLMKALLTHITKKRHYDDIFGTPEGAEAFAMQQQLEPAAAQLLELMQVTISLAPALQL